MVCFDVNLDAFILNVNTAQIGKAGGVPILAKTSVFLENPANGWAELALIPEK